jgi:hypothetical protein
LDIVTEEEADHPDINYQDTFNIAHSALEDLDQEDVDQDELAHLPLSSAKLSGAPASPSTQRLTQAASALHKVRVFILLFIDQQLTVSYRCEASSRHLAPVHSSGSTGRPNSNSFVASQLAVKHRSLSATHHYSRLQV